MTILQSVYLPGCCTVRNKRTETLPTEHIPFTRLLRITDTMNFLRCVEAMSVQCQCHTTVQGPYCTKRTVVLRNATAYFTQYFNSNALRTRNKPVRKRKTKSALLLYAYSLKTGHNNTHHSGRKFALQYNKSKTALTTPDSSDLTFPAISYISSDWVSVHPLKSYGTPSYG